MLNSFYILTPGIVAPSLHSDRDKPSMSGFNFMETLVTEAVRERWNRIRANLSIDSLYNEVWMPIADYEDSYLVSNFLRVKSVERIVSEKKGVRLCEKPIHQKILAQKQNEDGYWEVRLSKDSVRQNKRVHRLYAMAFIDNPENKPFINHKNLIKSDNIPFNLEWNTIDENTKHAQINGAILCGEEVNHAKLTKEQVLHIHSCKETYSSLSKKYGVTERVIYLIRMGKIWKSVTEGQVNPNPVTYPNETVIALYKSPKSVPALSLEYNIPRNVIYRIKKKQTYKTLLNGLDD